MRRRCALKATRGDRIATDHADGHSVADLSREAAQDASSLHGSKTHLTGGQEAQVTEICFAGWKLKWNGIVRSRRANLPYIVCWQAVPWGASAGSTTDGLPS